jgi:hypothetical protein
LDLFRTTRGRGQLGHPRRVSLGAFMSKRTREEEGLALALASPECFPSSAALIFRCCCPLEATPFRRADAEPKEHRACRDWLERASN